MNILAHAYLAGPDEGLIIGNFIADFIKGNPAHPRHGLSEGVLAGVRLHRRIDTFTDAHPIIEEMRKVVRPRCHKYAGAAIDVFMDHFLALRFDTLAGIPLEVFVNRFYDLIGRNQGRLPAGAVRMAEYMIRHDWLTGYRSPEGIDRSLKGLARRTAFPSHLDTAVEDLTVHYRIFEDGFSRFFPLLQEDVDLFLKENA
ncbi:acyl carrier protein phosphodiesterase [Larkinella soli]|uniref:acyl carrier protein phosphodiesterase n=1 Tax=Larkinella soli TaxID=1770527 RepID=UPI000FFC8D66|nr:ACP phosphodiesterase [Larkinella soli]